MVDIEHDAVTGVLYLAELVELAVAGFGAVGNVFDVELSWDLDMYLGFDLSIVALFGGSVR